MVDFRVLEAPLHRVRVSLVFAVTLIACAYLAPAQSTAKQPAFLLVNVQDANGNAVRDLTKDSFRVKVNGRPAAVVAARYSFAPRRIVVLLDVSYSMVGEYEANKWQIARKAVEDLLAETQPDVPVAFLTFSSQVLDTFDFSQGRPSIAAWLKSSRSGQSKIKTPRRTALFDATVAGAKLLEPARAGDAIYAITDAGDNSSHISETDAKLRLLRSQIRLFVFALAGPMPTEEERSGADSFVELARDTGGFIFGVSSRYRGASPGYDYNEQTRERIRLSTRTLNIQVNGFYSLQVDAPPPGKRLSKVSLDIVDGAGKVRKDVSSLYQRGLPSQPR